MKIFNPKNFKQTRRDQGKELSHQHLSFSPSTKPPMNWRSFIECRQCKRSTVEAIGLAFINSNSPEADMRIWRHVAQTIARQILIFSLATDIYNIGLSLFQKLPQRDIIVQINVLHSQVCSYVSMNNLVKALELDPDHANIQNNASTTFFRCFTLH